MFDTMTFTKIMGGLCGTFLVFLLGKWAAEEIYHVGGGHGGEHEAAYVIEVDEGEGGGEEEEEAVTLASLYSEADVGAGERVFGKCKACHQAEDGANGVGPHLYGVVGRDVGSVDGFSYSGALSEAADVWTPENLYAFLENPSGYAPGTSMSYNGLSKPEDRANVIAFLDQTDGDMTEVAAEEGAEETASAEEGAEEGSTEEAATEEASSEEGSEEEATEEAAAEEGSEEGATEEASAEGSEDATEEASEEGSDEQATEEASADESSDESGSEEQASEESSGGEGSAFAELVAAADVGDGERAFRKCAACHKAEEEANGVGPHLVGVVGRDQASVEGFNYSDALAGLGGQWTPDELNAWLEDPKGYAPGNKMAYRGVRDEEERAALVKYLESTGG